MVTRTTLLSGCCAWSVTPPVCVWKRRRQLASLGAEALAHEPRVQPARRAELRDLLEQVVVRGEEEREPRRERVDREPGVDRALRRTPSRSAKVNASSCTAVAPASRMW